MKVMTKAILTLSIGAAALLAAPKPLMNPFADTIQSNNNQVNTVLPAAGAQQQVTVQNPVDTRINNNTLATSYQAAPLPTSQNVRATQPIVMTRASKTRLVVRGQGVAPSFTRSPAQAFAMAKRAALVDAYRLLGEKVQGVKVEGQDLIKNMMVKRSQVRTEVTAMIREATVIETEFKDGLCEVEVELIVSGARWHGTLSHSFAE